MSPLAGLRQFLAAHTEMSSANTKDGDSYPPLPPSLDVGHHELRDFSREQPDYGVSASTAPRYTPYLGLQARLSQTWINKWTILLLLVLVRVLLAVKNLDVDIANAKSEALSACTSVESVGSAMASMPHYMSAGVNALAADGVTSAMHGLMTMLDLTVSGVEAILLFIINFYTQMWVCLITLVADGAAHAGLEMIEKVGNLMNETIGRITPLITSGMDSFESDLTKFLGDLGGVIGTLGGSKSPSPPNFSSEITALNSISFNNASFNADLTSLNSSLPTFAQVQNFTESAISIPFAMVKKAINESKSGYTFDKSVFPVPEKQALTFCSKNNSIDSFFQGLSDAAHLARKVFIVVIVILAALACIPMAFRELWGWRTMRSRALLLQNHNFDTLDVLYIAGRPYTSTAGMKIASKAKSAKRQILTRWAVAYATSIPALFVLMLGAAGLFSVLCQYILLKTVEDKVPALSAEVGDFAGAVVNALTNASEAWATSANSVISSANTKINSDVFGWVNTSTIALNNTLNDFVDEYTSVLNSTFGGTILYGPVSNALNCVIGLKIDGVEKALTWVNENAHISFPEFANDTFSLGAAASLNNSSSANSFLANPASVTSDDITGAVVKMTNAFADGIHDELIVAGVLVGIWGLIVLTGVARALICMFARDRTRAEGGPAYLGENPAAPPPLAPRSPDGDHDAAATAGTAAKFPAFEVSSAHPDALGARDDETWITGGLGLGPPPFESHEKLGRAGQRSVGVNQAHVRSSSHGFVTNDEKC
ncbi:MAG: plasma membrane fusion protein prm1 [Claussenomyces sp. TS43310]|nr:MAG: plasma membrane fusion protein prm1 [Claussenomyces sp. TS43310]